MKGSEKVRKNHLKQDWTISVDWLEGQTHLAFPNKKMCGASKESSQVQQKFFCQTAYDKMSSTQSR